MTNDFKCDLGCKSAAECERKSGGLLHKIMRAAKNIEVLSRMQPMDFLAYSTPQPKRITEAEFHGHDCHLGEEDGCTVCETYHQQRAAERRAVDTAMSKLDSF